MCNSLWVFRAHFHIVPFLGQNVQSFERRSLSLVREWKQNKRPRSNNLSPHRSKLARASTHSSRSSTRGQPNWQIKVYPFFHSLDERTRKVNVQLMETSFWIILYRFFDIYCFDKTRNQLNADLAELAENSVGIPRQQVYDRLKYSAPDDISKNYGNAVTNDLKWHIKIYRHNHIHVSPTAVVNGVIANDISSSWTLLDWRKYILALFDWRLFYINTTSS